jgi:hypothetical protein
MKLLGMNCEVLGGKGEYKRRPAYKINLVFLISILKGSIKFFTDELLLVIKWIDLLVGYKECH